MDVKHHVYLKIANSWGKCQFCCWCLFVYFVLFLLLLVLFLVVVFGRGGGGGGGAFYNTSNKFLLVARHTLTRGLEKCR